MNTDIDIVTITRVLADGSHVSLGDSRSTVEQLVAALDAMTEGREVVDDIFTHQTIKIPHDFNGDGCLPVLDTTHKPDVVNQPNYPRNPNKLAFTNQFLVF